MNTGSCDVAVERGLGRPPQFARIRLNGAAPLIGSSQAIRQVRARIERLAATPFAILIEGGFGPQPYSRAAVPGAPFVYDGDGEWRERVGWPLESRMCALWCPKMACS
jgi:hypothetical protein